MPPLQKIGDKLFSHQSIELEQKMSKIRSLRLQVRVLFFFLGLLLLKIRGPLFFNPIASQLPIALENAKVAMAKAFPSDFTYGTVIAGLNSPGAYSQLETNVQGFLKDDHYGINCHVSGYSIGIFTYEYHGIGPSGGIGHVLYELALLLSKHNAIVTLVYLGEDRMEDKIVRDYAARGISIVKAPPPKVTLSPNHVTLQPSYKALHFLMESEAKNEIFDIIHFNDYLGHALFPLYAKKQGWLLANTQVVITLHGPASWARLASGMSLPRNLDEISIDWYELEAISQADYIWAPSKFMAAYVASRGVELKHERVYNLANTPPSSQIEVSPSVGEINRILEIVFFGRLEIRKGPLLFVKALNLLVKKHLGILVRLS